MKELLFTPSDFTAAPTGNAVAMSEWTNKKLVRKLEKAIKAYSANADAQTTWRTDSSGATYSARVVCIERIDDFNDDK